MGTENYVSNAGLREAFLASPVTTAEVAGRCGFYRPDGTTDDTKVARLLGVRPYSQKRAGKPRHYFRYQINESDAILLAEALRVYPTEVGF